MSYNDADEYCKWKSKKEGREYRLPTEIEWEKAARKTDGRVYPWGDEFDKEKCSSYESGIEGTTPVDQFPEGVACMGVNG